MTRATASSLTQHAHPDHTRHCYQHQVRPGRPNRNTRGRLGRRHRSSSRTSSMAFLLSAPGAPTRWEGCVQPPQHLGPQSGPWCDWPLGFCQMGPGVLCASPRRCGRPRRRQSDRRLYLCRNLPRHSYICWSSVICSSCCLLPPPTSTTSLWYRSTVPHFNLELNRG